MLSQFDQKSIGAGKISGFIQNNNLRLEALNFADEVFFVMGRNADHLKPVLLEQQAFNAGPHQQIIFDNNYAPFDLMVNSLGHDVPYVYRPEPDVSQNRKQYTKAPEKSEAEVQKFKMAVLAKAS